MIISLLGLQKRTKKFYTKYNLLSSSKSIVDIFISRGGMKFLTSILNSAIPIKDIWRLISVVCKLFNISTVSANERYLPGYFEALISKFD